MLMQTTEIRTSRKKILQKLVIGLVFAVSLEWGLGHPKTGALLWLTWAALLGTGLVSLVLVGLLLCPLRLLLDDEGFVVANCFARSPKRYWRDIERIFLSPLGRGRTWIAYTQRGQQRFLPGAWPLSHEEMVDELNRRRLHAAHAMGNAAQKI